MKNTGRVYAGDPYIARLSSALFYGDCILFRLLVPVLQTRFPAEKRHMFALNLFSLKQEIGMEYNGVS